MPDATQNPGRRSCRRPSDDVTRNRPTDGSHRTVVYLARMPVPTARPASGHAHVRPLTAAACPNTSAHPQHARYGGSIVISDETATTGGKVSASPTRAHAKRSRPRVWTVRTYMLS